MLMQVLRGKVNFVVSQQFVQHVKEDVRFARIARAADQHPKDVRWHGRVPLYVVAAQFI